METSKPRAYKTFKIFNLIVIFKNGIESPFGSFLSLDDAESCEFWVLKEGFGADNEKVKTKITTQSVRLPIVYEMHPLFKEIEKEQKKIEVKRQARGY